MRKWWRRDEVGVGEGEGGGGKIIFSRGLIIFFLKSIKNENLKRK